MLRTLISTGLALAALVSTARADVGKPPPELEAVKWYNSPPLLLGELQGKAVMIEVFRTW